MGITIRSKRHSCNLGYGGFGRFRNLVAKNVSEEFYNHYLSLSDAKVMFLSEKEREEYCKNHDISTNKHIEQGTVTAAIANFLYQSDCDGKIDKKQAKQIYTLIKEYDNNLTFGYIGRTDCATMYDLKKIFSDGTKVEWY